MIASYVQGISFFFFLFARRRGAGYVLSGHPSVADFEAEGQNRKHI